VILITNKDKLNSEDFEFLKDMFGDSKKKKKGLKSLIIMNLRNHIKKSPKKQN
jgi:hypothetical protein